MDGTGNNKQPKMKQVATLTVKFKNGDHHREIGISVEEAKSTFFQISEGLMSDSEFIRVEKENLDIIFRREDFDIAFMRVCWVPIEPKIETKEEPKKTKKWWNRRK